jgi:phosphate transport system ATP-binding protein
MTQANTGQTADNQATNQINEQFADRIIEARQVSVFYGTKPAVQQIDLDVERYKITALIGPSGCGKTTLLRSFNRMNDLIPIARTEGQILFEGQDLYSPGVDPTEIRYKIGMVFQRPNPFPKSIYDNIAFGPRINGFRGDMDELVERSLKGAALWDEVKDRLRSSGLSLSGGQQQRVAIARALAMEPEVMLFDEVTSSLDPELVGEVLNVMRDLSSEGMTMIVVTHELGFAYHLAKQVLFLHDGVIHEQGSPDDVLKNPKEERTKQFLEGFTDFYF